MDEQYYLITPIGTVYCEVPKSETEKLVRNVWVTNCPCCGGIRGYYSTEKEAKENADLCSECSLLLLRPLIKYKAYKNDDVKMRIAVKGTTKINDKLYLYFKLLNN